MGPAMTRAKDPTAGAKLAVHGNTLVFDIETEVAANRGAAAMRGQLSGLLIIRKPVHDNTADVSSRQEESARDVLTALPVSPGHASALLAARTGSGTPPAAHQPARTNAGPSCRIRQGRRVSGMMVIRFFTIGGRWTLGSPVAGAPTSSSSGTRCSESSNIPPEWANSRLTRI
jgi:hypothetical protein